MKIFAQALPGFRPLGKNLFVPKASAIGHEPPPLLFAIVQHWLIF